MLIRSAREAERRAILHPEDALTEPRLSEVWTRYARTAALALRAAEGWAMLRRHADWAVVGTSAGASGVVDSRFVHGLQIGRPADRAVARSGTFAEIGVFVTAAPWGEFGLLCVRSPEPRKWSRREWRVLESLATSLGNELWLRTGANAPLRPRPEEAEPTSVELALDRDAEVNATLRRAILAAVHDGSANPGDRLPSIREVADACGATTYAAAQAYRALEEEGLVEKKERSGIFIAPLGETPARRLPETAGWLRGVLAEGYMLQVRLPALPDLIQRWTTSAPLRCACVESTEDYRFALCDEVHNSFGLETIDVPARDNSPLARESLESAVRRADLIVTTPFHLSRLRGLAARLDVPLIVATLDVSSATVLRNRARTAGDVPLVCVDPEFGRRMATNLAAGDRERVRIIPVADRAAMDRIDRSQPVLLTKAARQIVGGDGFRLVLPHYPAFSKRFAERLAHTIIQLNLEGMRATRPAR